MRIKLNILQILFVSFLLIQYSSLTAQTDSLTSISSSVNVDLVSRYIWRGQEYGQAPSIQPGLSATWKGFTLGAWGAYKFTGAGMQETDFYISNKSGPVTFTICDYWSFCDTSSMDFFNYNKKTTPHILEAQVLISGGEKLPFNLLAGYFFYGADKSKSIYFELQYMFSAGPADMMLFAGFQPKGEYYAPDPGFVNIGCTAKKTISVTDRFSLPLSLSLIVNPNINSVYLVAGITL